MAKSRYSPLVYTAALALFISTLFVLPTTGAWADGEELRPIPYRDGSTPEIREKYMRGFTNKAAQRPQNTLMDADINNIAMLVDDGTLVVGGLTDTDAIAARFYASHSDIYDYINIYTSSAFEPQIDPEAGFAFEQNIKNTVTGINLSTFNFGPSVAPGVNDLRSILNMNDLGEYAEDPSENLVGFLNTFSGISILGQEAAHMVGAFVNATSADILGRANAHWNYFFQSYASSNEGNHWQDNGDGTFTTIASGDGYSQLDNYLYGFLGPGSFSDPMFVIETPVPDLVANGGDSALPTTGVTVSGTDQTVVIGDITDPAAGNGGTRNPSVATSQKGYRMAFILVVPAGTVTPEAHDLEKIDDFRRQWEEYWDIETNGVGIMDASVADANVTADFEANVVSGEPGLTVTFDNDSFGSITSYSWTFGDGGVSSERNPTHTYNTPGVYDVTLTVDGVGGPAVATRNGYITVGTKTTYFTDDFAVPNGWSNDPAATATTGIWTRNEPVGTYVESQYGNDLIRASVQPELDHTVGEVNCLVTGNGGVPNSIGDDDIDGGDTIIRSPVIDLSAAVDPVFSYWSWYTNNASAEPGRDEFRVEVSTDGGTNYTEVKRVHSSHTFWRQEQIRLSEHSITPTSQMRFRFLAGDNNNGSLVEAAVDDVEIFDVETATDVVGPETGARFALGRNLPNPFAGTTAIRYSVPASGAEIDLRVYGVDGKLVRTLASGRVAGGTHTASWNGLDDNGRRVSNGVYLYRLQTPEGALTRKMYYVK